jgi:SAM-dependent methyltransferase
MQNSNVHLDSLRCPLCQRNEVQLWREAPDRYHGREKLYRLARCASCQLVWLLDAPEPSEMGEHYGAAYDRCIGDAGDDSPERWQGRRRTLAQYKAGGDILDLGCSSGSFLNTLKGGSWKLHGVEFSPAAARAAIERTGAEVFVGDVLDAPFKAESFDAITCFDVLEHVYQPLQVLEKVRQWLKPGGIFYVLVPNIDSAEARVFQSYWYGLELPRHLTHFSPQSLGTMAKMAGLGAMSLTTDKNRAFERSVYYIQERILRKVGVRRPPMAEAKTPGVPWKVARKLLRWSVIPAMSAAISLAGEGESIHGVFGKAENTARLEKVPDEVFAEV